MLPRRAAQDQDERDETIKAGFCGGHLIACVFSGHHTGKDFVMRTKYLIQAAVIGAIYAVLTIVLAPFSYGPMQIRVSEALTILPAFTPAAVPGLFIGCFVSNLIGPYGMVDMLCGSAATLVAAFLSYKLRNKSLLVPLAPVLINAVIIGGMLHFVYGIPNLPACMAWVALGQAIACYLLGWPLMKLLKNYRGILE